MGKNCFKINFPICIKKNTIHCKAKSFSPNQCKISTRHPDILILKISTSEQDKTLKPGVTVDHMCGQFAAGFMCELWQIMHILQQKCCTKQLKK